jgi:hypothetical protein
MTRNVAIASFAVSLLLAACTGVVNSQIGGGGGDGGTGGGGGSECLPDPDSTGAMDCSGGVGDAWNCVRQASGKVVCTKNSYDVPGGSTNQWNCTDEGEFTQCESTSPDAPSTGSGWQCQKNAAGKVVCIENSPDEPAVGGPWDCVYDDVGNATCTSGGSDNSQWSCNYEGTKQICRKVKADKPNDQPGWQCVPIAGGVSCHSPTPGQSADEPGWNCKPENGGTTCTTPTPDQPGFGGPWECVYDDVGGVTCTSESSGDWTCVADASGNKICTEPNPETPDGGTWDCYDADGKTICVGSGDNPGGGGWICQTDDVGRTRCEKQPDYPPDQPGSGTWNCWYDDVGNRVCSDEAPDAPAPPGGGTPPGGPCEQGQKRWCDVATYCQWGQQECLPSGQWGTCNEIPGVRPNTLCGCYFFYYMPECCERPDCIVPPATNGQICPASAGKQCDYCSVTGHEQSCSSGFLCVTTSAAESFCGKECTDNPGSCASGYQCRQLNSGRKACVPNDESCYN